MYLLAIRLLVMLGGVSYTIKCYTEYQYQNNVLTNYTNISDIRWIVVNRVIHN